MAFFVLVTKFIQWCLVSLAFPIGELVMAMEIAYFSSEIGI